MCVSLLCECDKRYVGETSRPSSGRIKEHIKDNLLLKRKLKESGIISLKGDMLFCNSLRQNM